MESYLHVPESTYFLTLTYSDEEVPKTSAGELTLDKRDGRLFRLRLRERLGYMPRYFFVGEYGEKTERPHYHAIIYGAPPAGFDQVVEKTWGLGQTSTYWAVPQHLSYVAQYCTKKLTRPDDIRLGSRLPEFSQMSRRPALGDGFVQQLRNAQQHHINSTGDIAGVFRADGKLWPLGDRHKRMLRLDNNIPPTVARLRQRSPDLMAPPEPKPTADELRDRRQLEYSRARKAEIFRSKTPRV